MQRWLICVLHFALLPLWLCRHAAGLDAPACLQSPAVLNDPSTFVLHGYAVKQLRLCQARNYHTLSCARLQAAKQSAF